IPEGAVWNDDTAYRINDPQFWENYATHLRRTVENLRNHPSIVIWSLENEMYGSALNDRSPAKASLVELGRKMKQYDPTRLITYESDGDPGGVADVVGIHYPHEYPQFNLYPNTCYWMDEPIPMGHAFTNGTGKWKWNRKKPVYIGEFLWIPSSDPSWHTIFLGDDAYLDYRNARLTAKAMSWRMQIEAYRWYGVSGISPWTLIEGGPPGPGNILWEAQKDAYEPNAAFIKEYDSRFYAEDKVRRTIVLYNDTPENADLEVRLMWPSSVLIGKRLLTESSAKTRLAPGAKKTLTMDLVVPENVTRREDLGCGLQVLRDGKPVYAEDKAYSFFPGPTLSAPEGLRIGLLDRDGATRRLFAKYGVAAKKVDSLDDLEGLDLLVVGSNTLREGKSRMPVVGGNTSEGARLQEFVAKGGRALILGQKRYPAHLTIAAPTSHAYTIAFPQMPDHPILKGVRKGDLRWWRGDHLVSENDLERPRAGGCLPIVVSGSRAGIAFCPLVEVPEGAGTLVLCQMKLVEKFESEPAAALILNNILAYLGQFKASRVRTAVVSPSDALKQYLADVNLAYDDLTGRLHEADLTGYGLLIARDSAEELARSREAIERFVEDGGRVLLHRLTPDDLDRLRGLLRSSLDLQPNASPVARGDADDALLAYLTNEDLYWLGEHVGPVSWSPTPRAGNVADFIFGKSLEDKAILGRYDARAMNLSGHIVQKIEDGVVCATIGTVATDIRFPESGSYLFGLVLRGSPAGGGWPNADLRVDGELMGTIAAASREWRTYSVMGRVAAGTHEVTISFTNDANIGGEDRNLYVQALILARDPSPTKDVVFLTRPPALARLPRGNGFFVIDEVNWDTEDRNAVKASRYICGLLTGLGAQFRHVAGAYIEAEHLDPQPDMAHFRRDAASVYMASGGYIAGPFRCGKAGRYTFKVVARGTKAAGEYPIVQVRIDDEAVGSVELQSENWRGYSLPVQLSEGEHEIRLVFTNDYYNPPEDRNLALDRVEVYEAR
ncbi:MAG: carbohydrate-binding domain-containing protein, partial [Armatimonadota bacterium]